MFVRITINNIMVSFYVVITGLLPPLGVGFICFTNGLMVGTL